MQQLAWGMNKISRKELMDLVADEDIVKYKYLGWVKLVKDGQKGSRV